MCPIVNKDPDQLPLLLTLGYPQSTLLWARGTRCIQQHQSPLLSTPVYPDKIILLFCRPLLDPGELLLEITGLCSHFTLQMNCSCELLNPMLILQIRWTQNQIQKGI